MLLAVDIGNSHITVGVYEGDYLRLVARMLTDHRRTEDQYAIELKDIMELYHLSKFDITDAIISSVVPELTRSLANAIIKSIGVKSMILGPGLKTGLNIRLDNPAQLGADLAAGAVGALAKYPMPCIIFDLGTATTISALDENGTFVGGSICAGVGITLEALCAKTALLPHVSIEKPAYAIGRNTVGCMQAGLVYGTAAMMDGMADRMQNELGGQATLVATGGLAHVITPACTHSFILDENLLLDGLRIIYNKNKPSR